MYNKKCNLHIVRLLIFGNYMTRFFQRNVTNMLVKKPYKLYLTLSFGIPKKQIFGNVGTLVKTDTKGKIEW